jgi:GrpB-like predicted nucleotidyltransferase (UPF0157 family)
VKNDPLSEEYLRAHTVGEFQPLSGQIEIADYDPSWPGRFEAEAARIRAALGDRVLLLEHVGSTSVPDLPAKPVIDMLLVVADSSKEAAYVHDLERAGYILRNREPEWFEHRMFRCGRVDLNLHVFSAGASEIDRMLAFRDWLRTHPEDRELYVSVKRELAQREWKYMQNYADAKTAVVEQILAKCNLPR